MSGGLPAGTLGCASYSVQRFGALAHYPTGQTGVGTSISGSTLSWLQDSWTSAFYVRAPRSGKRIPPEDKKEVCHELKKRPIALGNAAHTGPRYNEFGLRRRWRWKLRQQRIYHYICFTDYRNGRARCNSPIHRNPYRRPEERRSGLEFDMHRGGK